MKQKNKRVVVYVPERDYTELRAKLILVGETVSSWFRKLIKDFLKS